MKRVTRRTFLRGTSVLAAGALAGMPKVALAKSSRESRILEFRVDLCIANPLVVRGTLVVDEEKDILIIRSFGLRGRKMEAETHLPLGTVKKIMKTRSPWILTAIVWKGEQVQKLRLKGSLEGDRFSLREVGKESVPFWIQRKDIQSVL